MRSSITLFDDQYKLYKTWSKKLLIAFVEYMFEGIEPDLKPSEMAIFNSLRERMDNSNKAHDWRSKWWKNSHWWPTWKSDEKWTKNESNLNEKWTKNEQKMNENGIQDSNGELESSNSWTTAIKRKKEEEDIKENIKRKFLDYVYLSESEYHKISDRYGERVLKDYIERLDNRIWEKPKSKDRQDRDHYRTILSRIKRAWIKERPQKQENETWVYENLRDQDVYLQELIKWKQK
jgi:hypothetical protein